MSGWIERELGGAFGVRATSGSRRLELPAVRVGRSFRVPEKAVHDYLEGAYFSAG